MPLIELACSREAFGTISPGCAVSRGNLFDPNDSSTWQDIGQYGINHDGVGLGAHLGYDVGVQFGLEKLGLGLNGPEFDDQTVGMIAAPEPFYLYVIRPLEGTDVKANIVLFQGHLWSQQSAHEFHFLGQHLIAILLDDPERPKENSKSQLQLHSRGEIPAETGLRPISVLRI